MGSVATWDDTAYGRRLLPTLLDRVAIEDPQRECMQIPRTHEPEDGYRIITWHDLANAVNRCAHRIVELCGPAEPNTFPTIAYVGPNDVRYIITMIACVKAGYKALFISPRNSKEGQLSLFTATDCHVLAYGASTRKLVEPLIQARPDMLAIEVSPVEAWFPDTDVPLFPYTKTFEQAEWDPLVVVHTSGSTGLPKPIIVRHGYFAATDAWHGLSTWRGSDISFRAWADSSKRIFNSLPLFHIAGLICSTCMTLYWDTPVALGVTDRPLSADVVVRTLASIDVDTAMLAPAIIEEMSQTDEGVRALLGLKSAMFGGGNLAREAGNRLVKKGVHLVNLIGASEWAPFPTYTTNDPSMWQYFNYNPDVLGCEFRRKQGEDDVYEMVIVRQPKTSKEHPGIQAVFYTFPELDEWSTKDLYRPHPTREHFWMYHGRADNILTFSNGEKLNPVTIEEIVSDHAELQGAMVVGSQKFCAGLIVEPIAHPETEEGKRALLDRVWPLVEKANEETVAHGRIARDMVILTNPDKPFPRAGKGTIQRAMAVKLYQPEIDGLYEGREDSNEEAPVLSLESEDALTQSIVEAFREHLAAPQLDAGVDFFAAGIDSLGVLNAAKLLRAGLKVQGHDLDSKALPPRIIYANSTPRRLASFLFQNVLGQNGSSGTQQSEDEQQQAAMKALYQQYTTDLIKASPNRPDARNENQVVLLTGSTGMLGSYLLDRLAHNPRVAKIICLNRASDGGRAQQVNALASRGLDTSVLETGAVEFLHVDVSRPGLGLDSEVYTRLQHETDRIIHNAWPVNFNIPIESFAPSLAGVRHIADLAASADRRVVVGFVSSIAVADRWAEQSKIPEARLEDLSLPGGGYGRSKAVGSLIIEDAGAKDAGDFPVAVVRVGQVGGPEGEKGMWNLQEWVPSLIASSLYLGALPRRLGAMNRVDWTPAERIARLVLEAIGAERIVAHSDELSGYYHGVNPHEADWEVLAAAIQEFYGEERIRELVDFGEWCDRLEKSGQLAQGKDEEAMVKKNPGIKLLDTYRGMSAAERPAVYDMAKTAERCPVVRETTAVTGKLMQHWCRQWGY